MIPGNEKGIQRVSNALVRAGALVYHEGNAQVHTSGHAMRDELVDLLELLRPRHFIPLHGEYRFLREHARLAEETVGARATVADWGDIVSVGRGGIELVGELDLEHCFVERPLIGTGEELKLRERRRLLYNGLVVAECRISRRKRGLQVASEITLYGVADPDDSLPQMIADKLSAEFINRDPSISTQDVMEEVKVLVRRVVRKRQERKPIVHVVIRS